MRINKSEDGVFYHRDVMAAKNMVNAAISIVETGQRPEFLTKKEHLELMEPGGKRSGWWKHKKAMYDSVAQKFK